MSNGKAMDQKATNGNPNLTWPMLPDLYKNSINVTSTQLGLEGGNCHDPRDQDQAIFLSQVYLDICTIFEITTVM
jgi:hypothetical protein